MIEPNNTTEYGTVNNTDRRTTMDKMVIVKQYVKEHPQPIQSLCPECIQYWSTADGEVTWNNVSGRREYGTISKRCWQKNYFVRTPAKYYNGLYVNYIPELEMMEVSTIMLKVGGRGKDGCPVKWEYDDKRMFAFKGDPDAYLENGERIQGSKFYCKDFIRRIHIGTYSNYHARSITLAQFVKMIDPKVEVEDGEGIATYQFGHWYEKNWVTRQINQRTKTILSFDPPMPEINVPEGAHIAIVHQILDDGYSVLRVFHEACESSFRWTNGEHIYHYHNKWTEKYRLFIDKKGQCTLVQKQYNSEKWIITNRYIYSYTGEPVVAVIGEPLEKCEAIKYVKDLIDWKEQRAVENLATIMRHPIVEQLSKAGYPRLAREICSNGEVAANLKHNFLVEKEKKLPLYKLLGVNKFILKAAEEKESGLSIIRNIKCLYSKSKEDTDVSYLSKETIDMIAVGLDRLSIYDIHCMLGRDHNYSYWHRYYLKEEVLELTDEEKKFVNKLMRLNTKAGDVNIPKMFLETYDMFRSLPDNRKPNVDIRIFDNANDLINLHNNIIEIKTQIDLERAAMYNAQTKAQLEMRQKKFEKLQEGRIKEFECDGDKYCIRVPHKLEEITQEGISLNHCVGGYVGRHAMGDTNIIFLRKRESENVPFYTIEVKDGTVVQIHGNHNKWLGNDPDAIPFVYKWVLDRGYSCEKKILLGLGNSYSCGSNFLDESYLTIS